MMEKLLYISSGCQWRIRVKLAFLFLSSFSLALAQQPITVPGSVVYDFHSKINNADYKLFVILPKSYDADPAQHYPVFYLLDGNDTATIAWLTRSRQHSDSEAVIFVGIGYPEPLAGPPIPLPGQAAAPPAQRSADYAIYNTTEPWSPPKDKGAPVFLDVIDREIVPYIDAHYRTNPQERALGGHSLGGLFTTYALFHDYGTFEKFWIGSPNLLWDQSVCFRYEAEYAATHHDLNARVIADVGGQESSTFMRDPLFAMMNAVQARHYPHLQWKTMILPNEDHGTLPVAGMPQVIDYLFGPPSVVLSSDEKAAIVGDWRLPQGSIIHFAYEGDLLFATGLPFLSNTAPQREQLITPLASDSFQLRTMLDIHLDRNAAGQQQLTIHKMRSSDEVIAKRVETTGHY